MENYYDVHELDDTAGWRDIASSPHSLAVLHHLLGDIIHKHFGPGKKIRWIDVGCGLGHSSTVAERLGFVYTGIDPSAKHIEQCKALYPGVNFIQGKWLEHHGEYELVTFISSLHHFEDWRAALQRAFDVVVGGGVVLVDHEPNRLYSRLFKWYSIHFRKADPAVMGKVEIHWFGKPSILPDELPPGDTQYHWDFFPLLGRLGIRTKSAVFGRFFEAYRKTMRKP